MARLVERCGRASETLECWAGRRHAPLKNAGRGWAGRRRVGSPPSRTQTTTQEQHNRTAAADVFDGRWAGRRRVGPPPSRTRDEAGPADNVGSPPSRTQTTEQQQRMYLTDFFVGERVGMSAALSLFCMRPLKNVCSASLSPPPPPPVLLSPTHHAAPLRASQPHQIMLGVGCPPTGRAWKSRLPRESVEEGGRGGGGGPSTPCAHATGPPLPRASSHTQLNRETGASWGLWVQPRPPASEGHSCPPPPPFWRHFIPPPIF
jgi:hypothetical protein